MTKLSDTQAIILGAAAQRDDRSVLPLPASIRGGAAAKVVGALLSRGLIIETTTDSRTKGDAALNRVWRNDAEGRAILLHITDAGLAAIGIEADSPDAAPKARTPRPGTKQARIIELLRADAGATIEEIAATTNWAPHTVRGAMSGALKKRLGLTITSETVADRGRVYRIAPETTVTSG